MFYTMKEVCAMFNVTRTTISRWEDPEEGNGFPPRSYLGISRPGKRYNGRIGFLKTAVDAWAQARTRGQAPLSREQHLGTPR
jgi:predicted DNA-binding transcriptional regulator AlpA